MLSQLALTKLAMKGLDLNLMRIINFLIEFKELNKIQLMELTKLSLEEIEKPLSELEKLKSVQKENGFYSVNKPLELLNELIDSIEQRKLLQPIPA